MPGSVVVLEDIQLLVAQATPEALRTSLADQGRLAVPTPLVVPTRQEVLIPQAVSLLLGHAPHRNIGGIMRVASNPLVLMDTVTLIGRG